MPTDSAVVYTSIQDSREAALDLSAQIASAMPGAPPDALILFASPQYEHGGLLAGIQQQCRPRIMVGASSAGEFTSDVRGENMACALALRSTEMVFSVGIGHGISTDARGAARQLVSTFKGMADQTHPFRSALVMTDALAGHAEALVDELTLATQGRYQFFGGGAGDNAQFKRTQVFRNGEAYSNAAVALEILSSKPVGVGVGHGWEPAGKGMRVTAADGMRLISLNGLPARDAFEAHARATGQRLDAEVPIPFFLHNILGIAVGSEYRLRVPLAFNTDGSVHCASEVPVGSVVHIMRTTAASAVEAAARATNAALAGLQGNKPGVALFFDCVATRLRMGETFGFELKAMADGLGNARYAGCNTHGQIARSEGQFSGFHNCTAVVCVLAE